VYKAGLAFAQDNGERLPWQLTSSGCRNHVDPGATAGAQYGRQANTSVNEVSAHMKVRDHSAGNFGLVSMKAELVTPKIIHSPTDATRAAGSEIVQENWSRYDTMRQWGRSAQLGQGTSYNLVAGADTQRPSSVYATTRNWIGGDLRGGEWSGSDSRPRNRETMSGLTASQGQVVTMDGGAKQSTNADFQAQGTIVKAARTATGGCATGRTSTRIIKGNGF